jgi:hypothetical protein
MGAREKKGAADRFENSDEMRTIRCPFSSRSSLSPALSSNCVGRKGEDVRTDAITSFEHADLYCDLV